MHDLAQGRILLTGGAGLIGSTVLWALNRRGIDDVLVVDRLDESEKWKHLVPLRFADYLDADELADSIESGADEFENVRTVIH
ncbi:MAG TPA: NAD-dependent epimerase/dehydratase family protein, partial [Candidatus Dormibacteraeota bacterium]|nr:NAD-dependent epimerase/dehydratase family protein [Candidatus Dormibacteraeota bacterium]